MATTPARRARRFGKSAFLLVASLLMIVPFLWALSTSFKLPGDVFAYPPRFLPDPATLANFENVVTMIPFPRYLLNSTIVTGTIVILNVVFGTAAAYAFAKLRFPGRDTIFFLLLLTLMVPFQVNLIPLYKMMVELHKAIPPLGADTYFGLIAPSMVSVFGIFLMRGFLRSIPDEILESARMDGASEWRVLRSIVFPLAVPGMATLAIFTFLAAWNDFLWPLVVTSSDDMRTLPGRARPARPPERLGLGHDDGRDGDHGGADDPRVPAPPAPLHRGPDDGSRQGRRLTGVGTVRRGRHFLERDGRAIFPVGAHYVPVEGPDWPWRVGADAFDRAFAAMAAAGLDTVRIDLLWAAIEPEPGRYDEAHLGVLDEILAAARGHGLLLHPTLFVGGEVGDAYWDLPWRAGRHPHRDPVLLRPPGRPGRDARPALAGRPRDRRLGPDRRAAAVALSRHDRRGRGGLDDGRWPRRSGRTTRTTSSRSGPPARRSAPGRSGPTSWPTRSTSRPSTPIRSTRPSSTRTVCSAAG